MLSKTMKAILIFDKINDLVFSNWDESFIERMKSFLQQENDSEFTDGYTVSQLLSPIITSQRVMASQFGNTYASMQCKDGTNIVFDEWLDHVLMIVTEDKIDDAHRELLDCKTLAQNICGQNINLLHSPVYREWLSVLLESRKKENSIPGANGVIGESGATCAALNALKVASKSLKSSPYQHYHLMLFIGDKLLSLYSSRGSEDLSSPDLILIGLHCLAAQGYWNGSEKTGDKDIYSYPRLPWLSVENSAIVYTYASATGSPCVPHAMHFVQVTTGITLILLFDLDLREISIPSQMSYQVLFNLKKLLLQRNLEMLPATIDSLEGTIKKIAEALRKSKSNINICNRLSSKITELKKCCTTTTPLTPETAATALHGALQEVTELLEPPIPAIKKDEILKALYEKLSPYFEFLRVKAARHFSLGSCGDNEDESGCSLTSRKYVDEFPGLVHFVYVDRTAGRYIAPDIADCADLLSTEKMRDMISRSLKLIREGYSAATWRSGALHVCYVMWWERAGVPVQPRPLHPAAVRALPPPADILGTFYRQLTEMAFPNDSRLVTINELLCVHLGLLPVATAVQQARRLAHAARDLAGADRPPAVEML